PRASGPDVRARFWLTVASGLALGTGLALTAAELPLAAALFFVAGALVGGVYPARRAVASLRTRTVDINVLMVIAVAGALGLGDWLEGASVVFLFALAQWLEARTPERAGEAIRALVDLTPRDALVARDGREERLPIEAIAIGDVVIV